MPVSERAFEFTPLTDEELTYGKRIHATWSPEGRACRELLALRAAVRELLAAEDDGSASVTDSAHACDAAMDGLRRLLAHIDGAQGGESDV